jgi:N-acetyl-anhydromuramyl-L-alanine amidase AmpD
MKNTLIAQRMTTVSALTIEKIYNKNCFVGRAGYKPRWLILHGTAGGTSAADVARYFASTEGTANAASATYIIGRAGERAQCNDEGDGAWANGFISEGHDPWWTQAINPNLVTINIEHCKPSTDNSDALTPAQQASSFALIRDICERWDIPMRAADAEGGITGHFSMDPVNRSRCPGPYPWDALWAYLNSVEGSIEPIGDDMPLQITDKFAATYFTDSGNGRWQCKTNKLMVIGEIKIYYCKIQGGPRLPTSGENHNIADVVWQAFECGLVTYDPKRKLDNPAIDGPCYMVKLDSKIAQDLLVAPKLAPVQKQLVTAQAQNALLLKQLAEATKPTIPPEQIDAAASTIATSLSALQAIEVGLVGALKDLGK